MKSPPSHETQSTKTTRVALPIYGLGCGGGGVLTVERVLLRIHGVRRVYANPATEMAYVEYDPEACSVGQLCDGIERAGFRAGDAIRR